MIDDRKIMRELAQDLNSYGFVPFCSLQPDSDENLPTLNSGKPVKSLLIVGNAGSEFGQNLVEDGNNFKLRTPLIIGLNPSCAKWQLLMILV